MDDTKIKTHSNSSDNEGGPVGEGDGRYDAVPQELRETPQWVCWGYKERHGKQAKVPVSPRTGQDTNHLDPDRWRTFEDAARFPGNGCVDGVGFVFSEDDPFCGVDLDAVLDPETGEIQDWAARVVRTLDSYTELSPSGTGLHVIIRGSLPGRGGPKTLSGGHTIEVYDGDRFFTITGLHLPGTPESVGEGEEALDELLPEEPAKAGPLPVPERLTEGSREPMLFSLAGSLHRRGLSAEEIFSSLMAVNEARCDPPKTEAEVREIAKKIGERGYEVDGKPRGVTRTDGADSADSTTGDMVPRVLPPAVPFPLDALPEIPRRLVREGALSTGTTPDMLAAMTLTALGGAVGTSRRLALSRKWKEFPGVWTCAIASSGDKKSPALKIALGPAYEEQGRLYRGWERKKEKHKQDLIQWREEQKQLKEAEKKKNKGDPNPYENVPPPRDKPEEPKLEHVFVQDITIEQLAEVLSETPRGVAAVWDELSGFFTSADQYKSGGRGNERTKYLSMWSGSPPLKVDRRGAEPIYAETPLVSVTGAIQPSTLPVMKKFGAVIGGDDGMAHRFLFSYPEPPTILRDRTGYEVSEITDNLYAFLYEQLRSLEPHADGSPVDVHFSEDGEEAFDRHNEAFRRRMYLPGVSEPYKSAVSKLASSQLARIALLFCLCRSVLGDGEEVVTGEDVEAAAKVIGYFLAHTRRVHAILFSETKEQRLLRVLSEVVAERGEDGGAGIQRLTLPATGLREALEKAGAHDLPAKNQLSKDLLALSEKEPRLRVRKVRPAKGRGLEVTLVPPDAPAHVPRTTPDTVGAVGSVGTSNAGETVPVLLPDKGGAALVVFALRQCGAMFPDEIAQKTGLAYGTVKKIVSELRKAKEIVDTGETRGQSRRVTLREVTSMCHTPKMGGGKDEPNEESEK